jgi:IS605 OrfB family transposase
MIYDTEELSQKNLHLQTYYPLRNTFGLKSQMAQSVLKTVIARYKSFQTNNQDWTLVNFKLPEYDLVYNRDYSLTEEYFSLNTLEGRIKVKYNNTAFEQYFDGSWKFGTAKLVNKHGKWFLHIPFSKEAEEPKFTDTATVVGVDMGINFTATAYDSEGKTTFYNGRHIKDKRAKYKRLRKQLQKKQTPSARKRLKAIGQRENRWMTDVNHCVSKALIDKYGSNTLFVIEDLSGIRAATEKVCIKGCYTSVSWAFYELRKFLEYKSQKAGSITIAVDPKYTSQTCPKCGHIDKNNRDKKNHIFCCKACNYTSNDDRIGGMNLHNKGIEYLQAVAI